MLRINWLLHTETQCEQFIYLYDLLYRNVVMYNHKYMTENCIFGNRRPIKRWFIKAAEKRVHKCEISPHLIYTHIITINRPFRTKNNTRGVSLARGAVFLCIYNILSEQSACTHRWDIINRYRVCAVVQF